MKADDPARAATPVTAAPVEAAPGRRRPTSTCSLASPSSTRRSSLYFDAPDTGWASATVRLFADADHGMVLHTASFAFVQAALCRTPAKFCFTLDNTDGWGLSDGTAYVTTIKLTVRTAARRCPASPPP